MQHPVAANAHELHEELAAVRAVVQHTCPIHAVLDRLAILASGVVVACWQVQPGGVVESQLTSS
jgi:hypothetical protein